MTAQHTPAALARLAAPLRRLGLGGAVIVAVSGVALVLGLAAWLVRLGLVRSPLWVIGAWVAAAAVVLGAALIARALLARLAQPALAQEVEGRPGWRRGAVTAVLEGASNDTSPALFAAADVACAGVLRDDGPVALEPVRARWSRWIRASAAAGVVAALLFIGAGPHRGPVSLLWSPGEAWATFVAPVQVAVDRSTVDRGESVAVSVRAAGRSAAELWLRGKGELWRSETVLLDSTGRATKPIGPLESDLFAFVRSGGRTSDTVLVRVRLPAFLGRLSLIARYPAYLKLEDEALPTAGDTLLLPAGTRLTAAGETTANLAAARWRVGTSIVPLETSEKQFKGALTPRSSGLLQLELETADGAPMGGDPIRIPIIVVPDETPIVEVPVPAEDTTAVLGRELAMVIDVRDDHGISAVTVVVTKGEETVSTPIPLPAATSDRALLSTRFDLTGFNPEPGDTLSLVVSARDNAPTANIGRSRTFVLVVPTSTEVRNERREATREVAKTIDSLVAESKQLQRQTEDLSRERQRGNQADKGDGSLAFEDAKRAEQVARDQQDLMDQAEKLADQLEELDRAAERGGVADSAFRHQLEEIREQLEKAISPEMRKRLEELREALKNLDPQGAKEALKKLSEAQQKLKEALERTRELFKRAALEGELTSLEQESKDVAQQQREWNEKVGRIDSTQAAAEEQSLSARADSVAKGIDEASKQLDQGDRKESLEASANQARTAAQQMKDAAQSAKSGKKSQAKQQGENAAEQMEQVQKEVKEQREEQQDEWRQEVLDALDRALAETARLSQRQLALSSAVGRGNSIAQSRQEQAVIEEGVQKIIEQVLAVSGKNALISPQIGAALVQARLQMGRAREAVSSASANIREAADQAGEAVDALNVAAFQMLRSRDDVSGSSSASGLAEAMQRMQQLAGQQGSLSEEGNNLLSMLTSQQIQGQLQSLAAKQRQMAQDLERLRAETQAQGTRDLAEEARELARKLESGRIDRETVERQERLFKRMLDAGRTLQGEEKDEKKERESETPKTDSLSIPAPLRRLLDRNGQIRLPSWDELQRLSPEERRLVTDYFRRLTAREGR
jgi:hypothetical protein